VLFPFEDLIVLTDIKNEKLQTCLEQPRKGSCGGNKTRYYYDKSIGICRSYTYSGCNETANSFETQSLCNKTCIERNLTMFANHSKPVVF
uniref:BPTI/Kunitz inhibitor domain-containing protein n=1 Tax=Syphacia muris TaxID=451379 RepID=A0A0N5AIY0_9BILA